jgi:hypothetical protein
MFDDIYPKIKKPKEKTVFVTCISCGRPVKDGEKCVFCNNVKEKDKIRDTKDGL